MLRSDDIRAIPPKIREAPGESSSTPQGSEEVVGLAPAAALFFKEDKTPQLNEDNENESSSFIAEEWEQLIVTELPNIHSPTPICKPKLDHPVPSQLPSNRQIDEKTSKILERLEVPRQLKKKTPSPNTPGSAESCMFAKKPLIPYGPADDQGTRASQPIKPNFQKLKRKR